jgi:hypothetical protein
LVERRQEMPAKTAQLDAKFFPAELAEYEVEHNPGHDLLAMLKQCAEAPPEKFNRVFAAYSRNPIAILLGAAAIEGYTNYAGHHICKDWNEYIKGNRSFPEKLRHLFSATENPDALLSDLKLDDYPFRQSFSAGCSILEQREWVGLVGAEKDLVRAMTSHALTRHRSLSLRTKRLRER